MRIVVAKLVPIQLTINSIMLGAMQARADDRGILLTRYASQLLEAAWAARVQPNGADPEMEAAVARQPPSQSSGSKMVERINDGERRMRDLEADNARLRAAITVIGAKVIDGERWRVAFGRTRRRLDAVYARIPAAAAATPPTSAARGETLPPSVAKAIRSQLALGSSASQVARQYGLAVETVKAMRR